MTLPSNWYFWGIFAVSLGLIWLLASVITPFVIAAYIAYLANPLVTRLNQHKIPRTLSVTLVFLLVILLLFAAITGLIPILMNQFKLLIQLTPKVLNWLQITISYWLTKIPYLDLQLDLDTLSQQIFPQWQEAGNLIGKTWQAFVYSGNAIFTALLYLLLIPVVAFYCMRDWENLTAYKPAWFSLPIVQSLISALKEIDQILKRFLRGQLSLMVILAVLYSIALYSIGIAVGIFLGILIGVLTIVPYLGTIIGLILASLFTLIQFQDFIHVIYVWLIFAGLLTFENFVLAPKLLGNSLGLHPIAVIFALLAGGHLFGLVGVLLALPATAVVKVASHRLDHSLTQYANRTTSQSKSAEA